MSKKKAGILLSLMGMALTALSGLALVQDEDVEGCHDYPRLARMNGFAITDCERDFDAEEFYIGDDKTETVEGWKTVIDYSFKEDADPPDSLRIRTHYSGAVNMLKGRCLYESDDYASFKIIRDGREIWIQLEVYNSGFDYTLTILEKGEGEQDANAPENRFSEDRAGNR